MRKYAETLVNYAGANFYKRVGNHSVELWTWLNSIRYLDDATNAYKRVDNPTRIFRYHDHIICIVNDNTKQFWLSHAGWFTPSTTQALNSYREWFSRLGYKCMTD